MIEDRTPDEIALSAAADAEARRTVAGVARLLDLWIAEPLGLVGAREVGWGTPQEVLDGGQAEVVAGAQELAERFRALHWPLAFPEVFGRERPGFDAVVGNPPWNEITVEELSFFTRFAPGLRGLPQGERRLEDDPGTSTPRFCSASLATTARTLDRLLRGDGEPEASATIAA